MLRIEIPIWVFLFALLFLLISKQTKICNNVHIIAARCFNDTACNVKLALDRVVHLANILNTA